MAASARLVEVWRGPVLESAHRGHVAVVDAEGRCLAWAGDPRAPTLWRSAAKPIQSLPLVETGALDGLRLGPAELAVACGSHAGTEAHVSVVDRLLAAAGAREPNLVCEPMLPTDRRAREHQSQPTRRHHPCSGKHAAMLAVCAHLGWPLGGYEQPAHPVQQLIRERVSEFAGQAPLPAVDGCGVPTFVLPLRAIAAAYARLSGERGRRTLAALRAHPDMVAGPDRLTSDLLRAGVIAKEGAEGVYCALLPDRGWGIALKIEDGAPRAGGVALLHVLESLAALAAGRVEELRQGEHKRYRAAPGTLRAVFRLRSPA